MIDSIIKRFYLLCIILFLIYICILVCQNRENFTPADNNAAYSINSLARNIHANEDKYKNLYTVSLIQRKYLSDDWIRDDNKNLVFQNKDVLQDFSFEGYEKNFAFIFKIDTKNMCEKILKEEWQNLKKVTIATESGKKVQIVGENLPASDFVVGKICSDKKYNVHLIFK